MCVRASIYTYSLLGSNIYTYRALLLISFYVTVQTLQIISQKLELSRFWRNINQSSCIQPDKDFNNTVILDTKILHNVTCDDCTSDNNTVCHINRMYDFLSLVSVKTLSFTSQILRN